MEAALLIYLVDLNYTLAVRRRGDQRPLARLFPDEQYRSWLVHLLRPAFAILVTARPKAWQPRTFDRIQRLTGWRSQASFFNDRREPPPIFKSRVFTEKSAPPFGDDPAMYFAIESNPRTRTAYVRLGVVSATIPQDAEPPWTALPVADGSRSTASSTP